LHQSGGVDVGRKRRDEHLDASGARGVRRIA
jgi:hypothetical protein